MPQCPVALTPIDRCSPMWSSALIIQILYIYSCHETGASRDIIGPTVYIISGRNDLEDGDKASVSDCVSL